MSPPCHFSYTFHIIKNDMLSHSLLKAIKIKSRLHFQWVVVVSKVKKTHKLLENK